MAGESTLTFEGVLGPGGAALVAAILVAAALWSALRARRARAALFLLRTIAVLALALALLGPARVAHEDVVVKAPVYVLVDASRSMSVRDGSAETRREQVVRWTRREAVVVDRLAARHELVRFDFSDRLVEVREWGTAADGSLTATGDAICAAVRRMKGRPGGAIVVISDGRTTAGFDPVRAALQAKERGVRVHAVAVGEAAAGTFRDRAVANLVCPAVAQVGAAVPIHGYITAIGEKGRTLSVRLRIDDEVVETREVAAEGDRFSSRVPFLYVPEAAGEKRVAVEVEAADGEFDPKNNSMSAVMRVAQKDLRILFVEGKLRWECTFLKRALVRLPGSHVAAPAEPPDAAELDKYNVVIIGDVTASRLGAPFLEALEKLVSEREAGLLFLAGAGNLGEGAGWSGTAMAALLPFEPGGSAPPTECSAGVQVTSFGAEHFAVALDRDAGANVRAWKDLPKLEAVARAGALKPGTSVLAETEEGAPLLVAQAYGKGRTLAFLGETAWKWALDSDAAAEKYRRFWHQCVLWLARKEKSARRLWTELDRSLFLAGDLVEVTVTVEDPPGTPVSDAVVRIRVEGPAGERPATAATFYGGAYHATLLPTEAGGYRVNVEARRDKEDYGNGTVRFQVIAPSAELDRPGADLDALVAVASAGGGICKPLAEARAVLEQAERDAQPLRARRVHRRSLWDRAWLVLLFVAALAAEWGVRKWHRMP